MPARKSPMKKPAPKYKTRKEILNALPMETVGAMTKDMSAKEVRALIKRIRAKLKIIHDGRPHELENLLQHLHAIAILKSGIEKETVSEKKVADKNLQRKLNLLLGHLFPRK